MSKRIIRADLKNTPVIISNDNSRYTSQEIANEMERIRRQLEGIGIEEKLVALCMSDSITQFVLSAYLWDADNIIMYINSMNGKEYAEKIIDNYQPNYIIFEKKAYEQSKYTENIKKADMLITGDQYVVCEYTEKKCEALQNKKGCIFFTSGTTDVPKAVFRSEANMINDAESNIVSFNITSRDKLLVTVPFGHVYGLGSGILPFAMKGAAIYFAPPFITGRGLKRIIENEKITAMISSPAVYQELCQEDIDIKECRLLLSAGSKLSSRLAVDFYQKYGKIINNMYGSSETGAIATLYEMEDTDNTNCGRAMHSITVFCDGTEENVGVIKVKSDSLAEGILSDGALIPLVDSEGWLEMNDMGYIDCRGCIHLICRKTDMINIGGEKLSPRTIEKVAEEYCEQALVLTQSSDEGVVYPILFVENLRIEFSDLKKKLKERLSYKFMPKKILVYDKFPRNANGKVDRNKLKEEMDGE